MDRRTKDWRKISPKFKKQDRAGDANLVENMLVKQVVKLKPKEVFKRDLRDIAHQKPVGRY